MKVIITQLGNPNRNAEEIRVSGRLFFNRGAMSDDIAQSISDNDITTEGNIQLFFQEMGSSKDNYGYFIFNKITLKDGDICYVFQLSILDGRIIDMDYIAQAICLPMSNRFVANNPNKKTYIKIGNDLFLIVAHTICNTTDFLISKIICNK